MSTYKVERVEKVGFESFDDDMSFIIKSIEELLISDDTFKIKPPKIVKCGVNLCDGKVIKGKSIYCNKCNRKQSATNDRRTKQSATDNRRIKQSAIKQSATDNRRIKQSATDNRRIKQSNTNYKRIKQ